MDASRRRRSGLETLHVKNTIGSTCDRLLATTRSGSPGHRQPPSHAQVVPGGPAIVTFGTSGGATREAMLTTPIGVFV
jgi:hypothetical protein